MDKCNLHRHHHKTRNVKKRTSRRASDHVPAMNWQTGSYSRFATYRFHIPHPFLLLCKLMEVTPQQVLTDFMNDLSHRNVPVSGDLPVSGGYKELPAAYFLERGYGDKFYDAEDRKLILREIEAMGSLYPHSAPADVLEMHAAWRTQYLSWWFGKWYRKFNRRPLGP